MNLVSKILLHTLSAIIVCFSISEANAQNVQVSDANKKEETSKGNAIIFRIEDIKPTTNEEGLVDSCTFVLTAYNRMNKGVQEADLSLKWVDNISGKYAIENGEIAVKKGNDAQTVVQTSMVIKNIPPKTQKSFAGKVDTNKCFLLFDNLEYTVNHCMNVGDKVDIKDSKIVSREAGCTNNFDYISSTNPEYYSEFKEVPESVIEMQNEAEKNNELAKVNEKYNSSMEDFKKIATTLGEIK